VVRRMEDGGVEDGVVGEEGGVVVEDVGERWRCSHVTGRRGDAPVSC